MPGGRPAKYKTPEELQEAIDSYFKDAFFAGNDEERETPKPITVSGMAYFLGFESRRSITDYKQKDKFSPTIKRARLRIEQFLEERLFGNNVAGIIFNLKNNFSWEDKKDISVEGMEIKPIINVTTTGD